jgi:hypothetical protein
LLKTLTFNGKDNYYIKTNNSLSLLNSEIAKNQKIKILNNKNFSYTSIFANSSLIATNLNIFKNGSFLLKDSSLRNSSFFPNISAQLFVDCIRQQFEVSSNFTLKSFQKSLKQGVDRLVNNICNIESFNNLAGIKIICKGR